MTQEEKAKAYDEVLERAKGLVDFCSDNELKTLKFVFSELRESEDEKSKKWILEYLYDGLRKSDEQFKEQFKAAIAWLEKQGEQNLAWDEEDKEMIDNIIDYMKPMPIFFESTKGKSGKEYTQKFVKNAINWLKSLKERIGE